MKQWSVWGVVLGLGLMVVANAAKAQEVGIASSQVEISLLVKGEITIGEDGEVVEYTLEDPGKLPPSVVQFIRASVAGWAFEPRRGTANLVKLRSRMNLLLVAREVEGGDFLMRLQAASFIPESTADGLAVAASGLKPPRYPKEAAIGGAQGTVYLILKVGRDGRVLDVVAEQVNLRLLESEKKMAELRKLFADASIRTARKWQFASTAGGADAGAEFRSVRVPVDFSLDEPPPYGGWTAYIPGPRAKAAWVDEELAGDSPEAMTAGTPRQLSKEGLRLVTPLP